jgi:hypothetical protein
MSIFWEVKFAPNYAEKLIFMGIATMTFNKKYRELTSASWKKSYI